jgi:hypothetical protein
VKAVLIPILLAGCATQPVHPPLTVEVDKVVTVRCVKVMPTRPLYATEKLTKEATDIQYGDALAVDWVLSRGYEKELEVAVKACLE